MNTVQRLLHYSKKTAQRGLTLVEMLVAMGLMSIFMLVLTDIVAAVGDVQTETDAKSTVAQDGKFMLARLSYDIQRATSITTPAAVGGSSTSLVLVIGGVTHTYSVSGGNLRLAVSPNTDNLNGSETSVSGFSVQRYGNTGGKHTITFSFTLTSDANNNGVAEAKTFTSTVGLR